jgi:hypothetical protein
LAQFVSAIDIGNGLPDVLEMGATVRYWRNLGNGHWDLPHEMSDAPAGLGLSDPGVQLIDADGDGRRCGFWEDAARGSEIDVSVANCVEL